MVVVEVVVLVGVVEVVMVYCSRGNSSSGSGYW